jgi:PAS domain S-box-containing protein
LSIINQQSSRINPEGGADMAKTLKGIRGRLFMLLIIVLVPVLLVEAVIYYQRYETRKAEELQVNLELARSVSRLFEAFLADIFHTQLAIGLAAKASPPLSNDSLLMMLKAAEGTNPVLRSYSWMTPDGVNTVSTNPKIVGRKATFPEQFSRIRAGEECAVTPVFVSSYSGDRVFTVFRGIRDEKGKVLGVVACTVVVDKLDHLMAIKRSRGAGISLIDNKGVHVYRHPRSEYTEEQRNWLKLYPVIEQVLKGEEKTVSHISKITGETRLVAFAPISSVGWVASASQAQNEALAAFSSALYSQALWTLLITLASFGVALALARSISNLIIGLRNHALALGQGKMENLVPVSGPGELKDLAVVFNQMAENVRSREATLRESEQRWATTLASIGDAVIATDLSGNITFMNKIAEELTGWTLSEAAAKPVATVFHIVNEHTRNRVEDVVAKVLKEGMIVGLANHTILVGKSGREIPIDDSGAPIRDHDGRVLGVVLIFRDITERKRAEEQVSRSQETFSELVERAPFGIYVVDSRFRIAHMNAGSQTGAFRNVRSVIGRDFSEAMRILWPEPVAAEIVAVFRHTLETGEPYYSPRFINPRHDVETVESYEWELHRMMLPDGQYGVICYYFDSTKLREAEAELRESEERLRLAQTAAMVGIWEWDLRSGELHWTPELDEIYGLEPGSVRVYEDFSRRVHPEDLAMTELKWKEAVAQHGGFELEFRVLQPTGKLVWIHSRGGATYDESGSAIRVFGVNMDITERKRAEEALRAAGEELKAIVDFAPVAIWTAHDPDCCRITGNVYADEIIMQTARGSNISRSAPPAEAAVSYTVSREGVELRPEELPAQLAAATGKAVPAFEMELRFHNGRSLHLLAGGVPLFDSQGKVRGAVVAGSDVTRLKRVEEDLRMAHGRLQTFFDHRIGGIGIVIANARGNILQANDCYLGILGCTREELLSGLVDWRRMTPPEWLPADERALDQLGERGVCDTYEKEYVRRDGSRVPVLITDAMMPGDSGDILAFVLDISDRKRVEQERERLLSAVREEKDRLSALVNSIQDEVWFADTEKRLTLVNPAVFKEFGSNDLQGEHVEKIAGRFQVFRPDGTLRPPFEAPPLRALRGEVVEAQEEIVRTAAGGELRHRQVSAAPVKDAGGNIIGSVSVVRDITALKQVEEALKQRTFELQHLNETLEHRVTERTVELADLTSRLVSAQENERRRVSYDLHDNVWQMLLTIRFEIERLFSGREDWAALRDKSKEVMTNVVGLVGKIRSMQGDLWPYVLDDVGLAATIDWYCREFEKNHSGLVIEIKNDFADGEIPSSPKIVIYRILQETLDNVAKHSQASRVTLRLTKKDHGMEFDVEDNGIGFDPEETIVRRAPWGGLGLLSIKARTELSGGSFEIESAGGKGTSIRASWPL